MRAAAFFSAAALAGSFGGLLAAAIALMDGIGGKYESAFSLKNICSCSIANKLHHRPGWAWIFIIEGLATMVVGFFCWWMVFNWPDTAVRIPKAFKQQIVFTNFI